MDISETIDRLLHDAQHKDSGAMMARTMRDIEAARKFDQEKAELIAEARTLYANNPGARWPDAEDCEWRP